MFITPRACLLLSSLVLSLSSCVEPPPQFATDMGLSLDMDVTTADQDVSPTPDASMPLPDMDLSSRILLLDEQAAPLSSVVMNAYSYKELNFQVFDASGTPLSLQGLVVTIQTSEESEDAPLYRSMSGRLESGDSSRGELLVRHESEGLELKIPYEVQPFSPRYRIPRVLHMPYDARIDFRDLLRVSPSQQRDDISMDAWTSRLLPDKVLWSLIEVKPDGTQQGLVELDDTLKDLIPQRHDYLLTLTYSIASQSSAPFTFPITIFTHEPTSLTSGLRHHCKTVHGALSCWGANDVGQLGTGDYLDRLSATPISAAPAFLSTQSGTAHMCAISADRQVHCWGNNDAEQTFIRRLAARDAPGDTPPQSYPSPTLLTPLTRIFQPRLTLESEIDAVTFTQVAPGRKHTCALSTRGVVYCWGDHSRGQLGTSSAWQENQLARGTELPPIEIPLNAMATRFSKVKAGLDHTCALSFDEELWCWGDNRQNQSNLDALDVDESLPSRVSLPGSSRLIDFWMSPTGTCAMNANTDIFCWGNNASQQLVPTETKARITEPLLLTAYGPEELPRPEVLDLSLGYTHSCSLTRRGDMQSVHCWGLGESGELGHGDETSQNLNATSSFPKSVLNVTQDPVSSLYIPTSKLDLSLMADSTCLLDQTSGEAACWGAQRRGLLGDNASAIHPPPRAAADYTLITQYPDVSEVRELKPALMQKSTCILAPVQGSEHLRPVCWGSNSHGQAGTKSISLTSPFEVAAPVLSTIPPLITGFASAGRRSCFIDDQSPTQQRCWGQNRRSPVSARLIVARDELVIPVPSLYNSPKSATHLVLSDLNTCSWHGSDPNHPPVCRGTRSHGALGNAHRPDFQDSGLDDGRDKMDEFVMEPKYFDISGEFNDRDNQDTITHFALGTLTGCMIRRGEMIAGTQPPEHLYALWCWGDVANAWSLELPALGPDKKWGDDVTYSADATPAQIEQYRAYLPRVLWTAQSAAPPRALALGDQFGCLIDAQGTLHCWGSPPLSNASAANADSLRAPFKIPVALLDDHTFWDISAARHTACLRHATLQNGSLTPEHTLTCLGTNTSGQTGVIEPSRTIAKNLVDDPLDPTTNALDTLTFSGLQELYQFTVGEEHVCTTGRLVGSPERALALACWGLDTHGQSRVGRATQGLYTGLIHTAALP